MSLDEGLVESSRLALYRAQEALGVLLVADGPVDAADEPAFAVPAEIPALQAGPWRTDLKLFATQQQAAERVLGDSSKDRLPYFDAVFQPSSTYPSQFFVPQNSWRFLTTLTVPIFDSGQRQALKLERQAAVDESRATYAARRRRRGRKCGPRARRSRAPSAASPARGPPPIRRSRSSTSSTSASAPAPRPTSR